MQQLDDLIGELEALTGACELPPAPKEGKEKKEKKEKGKSATESIAVTESVVKEDLDINALDLRVGVIVKVQKHETADKLYCEEIDIGEPDGPRAIASGLVPHYTLEEMQNRRLIVIANLPPKKLVGFKSQGMVLTHSLTQSLILSLTLTYLGTMCGQSHRC